jgi:NADP-dependent 3-hydroxy acid dehydrogenase YdfG
MAVFFVTGSSRGLGAAIVERALADGHQVVATAREAPDLGASSSSASCLPLALDVTDERAAHLAMTAALERFGRIDVLVNNAGANLLGSVEECSDHEVRRLFDINVFGLLNVTRACLPVLRNQGRGTVVNVGSVGGVRARTGFGTYAATKFAVEGISEALLAELEDLGLRVLLVEPGAISSDFRTVASTSMSARIVDDYAASVGRIRERMRRPDRMEACTPEAAAGLIVDVALDPAAPFRLPIGSDAVAEIDRKLAWVSAELTAWREAAGAVST